MSRYRIEQRTRAVVHHGRGFLEGYVHRFNHQGADGTAKGNIVPHPMGVHGVVYELNDTQAEALRKFEGGYDEIEVRVQLLLADEELSAYTYVSHRVSEGLMPTRAYVQHYLQGMIENQFPQDYAALIREQAALKDKP